METTAPAEAAAPLQQQQEPQQQQQRGQQGQEQQEQPASMDKEAEVKYGGYTRFEIELEFVQSLANPWYLNHLASQKFLAQPSFVAYLAYLQYWKRPPYLKYLTHPGPTLRHLDMLQSEQFRQDIMSPDLAGRLFEEGMRAAAAWHQDGEGDGAAVEAAAAAVEEGKSEAGEGTPAGAS